jgi:alpha-L-fucosidase
MQDWFINAKLGIFIHYGIYAVDGVPESWSMYTGQLSPDQYMRQLDGFTAANYDPAGWADLFVAAGARYAVLTARHHDGVALWDTGFGDLNVVTRTPAKRDLVVPFAAAMRQRGLRLGLYYSLSDWSHPDYASIRSRAERLEFNDNRLVAPAAGEPEDPRRWESYLAYRDGQVAELVDRFRPDLLWFDGEWERSEQQWRLGELASLIRSRNPSTVLNGRMMSYGDYATPEQALPIQAPDKPWELCLTINDSWGYQHGDDNHKSVGQLVRYFAETIAMGGNLLLDVGPKADGTIPTPQADRLRALGGWISRHAEAVYGTTAGLPAGHHYGPSVLSADQSTLYLYCLDPPRGHVGIKGLRNTVRRAYVVGSGTELGHHVTGGLDEVPGMTWIDPPQPADIDPYATVVALELDGPLDLYQGRGRR